MANPSTVPGAYTRAQDQREKDLAILDELAGHCLTISKLATNRIDDQYIPKRADVGAQIRAARALRVTVTLIIKLAEAETYDPERRDLAVDLLNDLTTQSWITVHAYTRGLQRASRPEPIELRTHSRAACGLAYTIALKTRLLQPPTKAEARRTLAATLAAKTIHKTAQIRQILHQQIGRDASGEPARLLAAEVEQRLLHEDIGADLATHTVHGIVLRLCRELGLNPDFTHWTGAEREAAEADLASRPVRPLRTVPPLTPQTPTLTPHTPPAPKPHRRE